MKQKFLSLLFVLFASSKLLAQPFSLDDRVKPVEFEFHDYNVKDSSKKGRISIATVSQTEDTMYFFAKGISIYSPVYVGVTGDKTCGELKISMHKENWHQANQAGSTDPKRHWETKFKTEGDFGIMVVAPVKPANYSIIVWNGKDVRPNMTSPFKTAGKSTGGGGIFSGKNLIIGIIALLVIVIGFLFYKLKNRKQ